MKLALQYNFVCHLKILLHIPLTSLCCVHSNVYGLGSIHCIKYLPAVYSIHSTSPAIHIIPTVVEIPPNNLAGKSSSIGEEPVRYDRAVTCFSAIEAITFTNVLQSHKTVVLVGCTSEPTPGITCTKCQCQGGVDVLQAMDNSRICLLFHERGKRQNFVQPFLASMKLLRLHTRFIKLYTKVMS